MSDDLLNQGCIYKFLSNFYFLPSSPAHRIDLRRCCLFPVPCTGLGWEEAIRGFVIYSLAFSQVTQGPPPTPLAPDVLKTKVNEQNPSLASLEASAWRVANTENLIFLRHCTLWSVCAVLYFFFPFSSKMALMLPVTTTRMRGGRGRLPEPCALGWHLCQHPLCGALRGHAEDADKAWTPLSSSGSTIQNDSNSPLGLESPIFLWKGNCLLSEAEEKRQIVFWRADAMCT